VAFLLLEFPVDLEYIIKYVSLVCKDRIGATRKTKVACTIEETTRKAQGLFGAFDDTCEAVQELLGWITDLDLPINSLKTNHESG
jgi:hypothetical protein